MTKKLAICYDGTFYTFTWLKAVLWARAELADLGVRVSFISPLEFLPFKRGRQSPHRPKILGKTDAILVAHHWSHRNGLAGLPVEQAAQVLTKLKQVTEQLVWLDTADSTGTARFDLIPYVDQYWKKQLLRNRARYTQPLWGGRIHSDYYHAHHSVDEDEDATRTFATLPVENANRLMLSWNVGAGDLFTSGPRAGFTRPRTYTAPIFMPSTSDRSIDVQFRGTEWPGAAGWQRSKAVHLMEGATGIKRPEPRSRVSHYEYMLEMRRSRAVLSPFGWGEICSRDFESFASGATLLKPDMGHLETFPNWFSPEETYVPLDWEFSNFDTVISAVRDRDPRLRAVAQNAQHVYQQFLTGSGKRQLAEHIAQNLGWL